MQVSSLDNVSTSTQLDLEPKATAPHHSECRVRQSAEPGSSSVSPVTKVESIGLTATTKQDPPAPSPPPPPPPPSPSQHKETLPPTPEHHHQKPNPTRSFLTVKPLNPSHPVLQTLHVLSHISNTHHLLLVPLTLGWPHILLSSPVYLCLAYTFDVFALASLLLEGFEKGVDEYGFEVEGLQMMEWWKRNGWRVLGAGMWDLIILGWARESLNSTVNLTPPLALIVFPLLRCLRLLPTIKTIQLLWSIPLPRLPKKSSRLLKCIVCVYIAIHYSACVFWTMGVWSADAKGWVFEKGLGSYELKDQYLKSFYAAQLAIFFDPRPSKTDLEHFYAILETLLASLIFGILFGVIIALVKSTLKTPASKMSKMLEMKEAKVKGYMASKGFPGRLQEEVRRHQRHVEGLMRGDEQKRAFEELPETLRQDICLYLDTLSSVPLLKDTPLRLRTSFARSLTLLTLPPRTIVYSSGDQSHNMYFIVKGSVEIVLESEKGWMGVVDLMREGEVFGEGCIGEGGGVRMETVMTREECDLGVIHTDAFDDICEQYPIMRPTFQHASRLRHAKWVLALRNLTETHRRHDHHTSKHLTTMSFMELSKKAGTASGMFPRNNNNNNNNSSTILKTKSFATESTSPPPPPPPPQQLKVPTPSPNKYLFSISHPKSTLTPPNPSPPDSPSLPSQTTSTTKSLSKLNPPKDTQKPSLLNIFISPKPSTTSQTFEPHLINPLSKKFKSLSMSKTSGLQLPEPGTEWDEKGMGEEDGAVGADWSDEEDRGDTDERETDGEEDGEVGLGGFCGDDDDDEEEEAEEEGKVVECTDDV
ncbi:hypothetical protein HDV05_006386 [Chytridiales sp. JEL 0842]|nr:hypothetical protein HDV05_006386 [Chytridiales sp. JEL 0842]